MNYLYLGTTPETPEGALRRTRPLLEAVFGLEIRETVLPGLEFAFDARRGQYASVRVLEMLGRVCPPDARKLIGFTGHDLFIPVLTFVFGHAQLGGRVAVVSLARLRQEFYGFQPDEEVLLDRAAKEALHETGHTFGLVHCPDRSCAMALSTSIRQVDEKRAGLCSRCAAQFSRGVNA